MTAVLEKTETKYDYYQLALNGEILDDNHPALANYDTGLPEGQLNHFYTKKQAKFYINYDLADEFADLEFEIIGKNLEPLDLDFMRHALNNWN